MLKQEFILLIPGIIYGVAIVDLLKLFRTRVYPELLGWGIFSLLSIVQSWLMLFYKLDKIATSNLDFLIIVVHSILMAKAIALLTPEEADKDTKEYFLQIVKPFAKILIAIILFNLVIQFTIYNDNAAIWYRLSGVLWCFLLIYSKKAWLRYIVLVVFLMSSLYTLLGDQFGL